ncbi:MAG: hypothetical protein RLZZ312_802 [Bacteroidota bacterium]|jgi:hypothetical protein
MFFIDHILHSQNNKFQFVYQQYLDATPPHKPNFSESLCGL